MNNEYPYAYAKGVYEGALTSLHYKSNIPGVVVKDWDKFREFLLEERLRIEKSVEEFRNITNRVNNLYK